MCFSLNDCAFLISCRVTRNHSRCSRGLLCLCEPRGLQRGIRRAYERIPRSSYSEVLSLRTLGTSTRTGSRGTPRARRCAMVVSRPQPRWTQPPASGRWRRRSLLCGATIIIIIIVLIIIGIATILLLVLLLRSIKLMIVSIIVTYPHLGLMKAPLPVCCVSQQLPYSLLIYN